MCLAIPGQLLEVKETDDPLFRTGRVSFAGIVREIQLACTPDARPGDYVLVHVGFAISVIDEDEARRTLENFAFEGNERAAGT
ncbi:MAG: HypC/HybG/HupF family hydrogenase formation chaperone [Verrucomicrobiales bacterium]|nr:HypC/HybG/HupF family hydrogenase formation chaperone [Verrucomicrobiales bacterium]